MSEQKEQLGFFKYWWDDGMVKNLSISKYKNSNFGNPGKLETWMKKIKKQKTPEQVHTAESKELQYKYHRVACIKTFLSTYLSTGPFRST